MPSSNNDNNNKQPIWPNNMS